MLTSDRLAAYAQSIRATALVFEDPRSRALQERLPRIAASDATVLIVGETGTGKELIARELHRLSQRSRAPFLALNCAALPEQLAESELFGHEKGAFTGAIAQKKGWFEAAQGGTLLLDEIGDLSPALQLKLLRVLQEREVSRVGSRATIPLDIRLIAATHVDLEEAVVAGRFRQDLYFRLNVAQLRVPSLADRPQDILPLCDHFIELHRARMGLPAPWLSDEARLALARYSWPGNIRELENVVQQALLVMTDNVIRVCDLNFTAGRLRATPMQEATAAWHGAGGPDLEVALMALFEAGGEELYSDLEGRIVRCAFDYCHRNQLQTARMLGISRNILRHRLKLYGLI